MSRPLFRCSSKPATTAADAVGQAQGRSSSPTGAGAGVAVAGGTLATSPVDVPRGVVVAGVEAAPVLGTAEPDVTGFATATSVEGAVTGGITRSTWPTSMTLGL